MRRRERQAARLAAAGEVLDRWLHGDRRELTRLRRRLQLVLTATLVVANAVGALVVAVLGLFIIPGPSVFSGDSAPVTFVVLPLYVAVAFAAGVGVGTRQALVTLSWTRSDRPPTPSQAQATFRVPLRLMRLQGLLWAGAVVVLTVAYGLAEPRNLPRALFSILFGGVVVCAVAFLLTEFVLRPVSARALRVQAPARRMGVRARLMLAWACGSAIPVVGVMVVASYALVRDDISAARLATTILALGVLMLAVGLLLMELVSRATMAPIRTVQSAMESVAGGDLSAEIALFDGTELGDLQAGFNDMAAGLREREKLRDLFGRHVGEQVAAEAMTQRIELGGEERDVAVVFVDVIGSTERSSTERPADTVRALNRFFTVVVEEVERRGGLVNKFMGDAALAVFGAPTRQADAAGTALAAARAVMARLAEDVPEMPAGAGVAAGCVLAGNVGTPERFEYTVIGDPVNEAARLADLAKADGGLMASGDVVARAGSDEAGRWRHARDEQLRGRAQRTAVHVPG
jgi:adenylate cyclase